MATLNHPLSPESDSETDFEYELPEPSRSSRTNSTKRDLSPDSYSSRKSISSQSSASSSKNQYLHPVSDTIEPLRPEQVRWFYREDGSKKWLPFIGYDSLRIECKYREVQHSKKKTNSDKFVSSNTEENICVRGSLFEVSVKENKCYPIYWHHKDQTAEIMRGTWFMDSTWAPLDENVSDEIEREHMAKFRDQKIDEKPKPDKKGQLPVLHSLKFEDFYLEWNANSVVSLHYESTTSKLYRALGNKLGLTNNGTRIHRGYCYEARIEDKLADIGHLVFVVHGIGQKMDTGNIVSRCAELRKTCLKVKEKHMPEIESDNVKRAEFLPVEWRSSLKLDGDIVESITPAKMFHIRSILNSSAMDILYYTSPLYRSEITQGLQKELNRLYDMFCQRTPYFEASRGKVSVIAHSLGSVIMYDIITGWNPIKLYDQYVSSVIDSLYCHRSQAEGDETCAELGVTGERVVTELEEARKNVAELEKKLFSLAEKQHIKTPSLKFTVTNFFCVGSPLAVFLALRGIRPTGGGTQDHILPKTLCSRLFNIYHPYDPVAYRLEPLIIKAYETITPIKIFRHDSAKKVPYDSIPPVAYSKKAAKKAKEKSPVIDTKEEQNNNKTETTKTPEKKSSSQKDKKDTGGWSSFFKRKDKVKVISEMTSMNTSTSSSHSNSPEKVSVRFNVTSEERSDDEEFTDLSSEITSLESPAVKLFTEGIFKEDKSELEHRLDYQIHEGKMENVYISAVTSHTSYWTNLDVSLFILQQLFPDIEPS